MLCSTKRLIIDKYPLLEYLYYKLAFVYCFLNVPVLVVQLFENPVDCVCGRSLFAKQEKMFSALFSRNNFFTRRGHFKELQVKGNLFDCSQILTVASYAYKQQNLVSEFFCSKYFFARAIFVRSIHIFLILFQKCSVTFH